MFKIKWRRVSAPVVDIYYYSRSGKEGITVAGPNTGNRDVNDTDIVVD